MGKLIKKTVIFCLGVMMFGIMPTMVDAAEFKWGSPAKENNVTRIPVKMVITDTDAASNFKLGCETNDLDVTCEVKQLSSQTTVQYLEGLYTYVGTEPGANFPVGEYELVEVVLTNTATIKKSEVEFSLKNAAIGGVSQSLSSKVSVGAKEVEKEKSNDATLSNIKVSTGVLSPEFSKDVKEYTVYQIKDTINKVKITPTCTVENTCTFELSGGKSISGSNVTLNMGDNQIILDVTSEDGSQTVTYKINIIRGETSYNSSRLSELTFGDYVLTPAFKPETTKYALTVPNEVTTITQIMKYVAEDTNAQDLIKVEGVDNFVVGENKLTITVNNVMNDETTVYEVFITRMSVENIEIIKYINNEVTFKDSDGIQTTLSIDEFKKTYPTEYENITNGVYKFDEEGNKIIEGLEDNDKEEEKDDKKDKKKDNKIWLIIILIVVGLVVIIVSGILIFKKKPQEIEETEEVVEETKEEAVTPVTTETVETEPTNVVPMENTTDFDEFGIEEAIIGKKFSNTLEGTVDIDEALNDLMSTKQYDFKDKE